METNQPRQISVQSQEEKTLYNSSYLSIFFRNFTAGLARAMGGLFMYLALMYVVGSLFVRFVLPELRPLLKTFESLGQLSSGKSGQSSISPGQAQQLLQQLQERNE